MENRSKGWVWFFSVICMGLFFAFFHNMYVFRDFRTIKFDILKKEDNPLISKVIKKERFRLAGREYNLVWMGNDNNTIPFYLKKPQTLRFKIVAFFPKSSDKKTKVIVSLNSKNATTLSPQWNSTEEVSRFVVPKDVFRNGRNILELTTIPDKKKLMAGLSSITIKNYLGKSSKFPRGYIVFDQNYLERGLSPFGNSYDYLLFPSAMCLMWIIGVNLMAWATSKPLSLAMKRWMIVYLPVIFILSVSFLFSILSPYTVILHPDSFFAVVLGPALIVLIYSLFYLVIWQSDRLFKGEPVFEIKKKGQTIIAKTQSTGKAVLSVIRFAGTTAILAFIVLLLSAGVLMILNRQHMAEKMADVAYFTLVFGILMRLFDIKRDDDL